MHGNGTLNTYNILLVNHQWAWSDMEIITVSVNGNQIFQADDDWIWNIRKRNPLFQGKSTNKPMKTKSSFDFKRQMICFLQNHSGVISQNRDPVDHSHYSGDIISYRSRANRCAKTLDFIERGVKINFIRESQHIRDIHRSLHSNVRNSSIHPHLTWCQNNFGAYGKQCLWFINMDWYRDSAWYSGWCLHHWRFHPHCHLHVWH